MTKICCRMDHRYRKVAEEQDAIGWRRFMEGMICPGLRGLQEIYNSQRIQCYRRAMGNRGNYKATQNHTWTMVVSLHPGPQQD
jgi:hypothetical protein